MVGPFLLSVRIILSNDIETVDITHPELDLILHVSNQKYVFSSSWRNQSCRGMYDLRMGYLVRYKLYERLIACYIILFEVVNTEISCRDCTIQINSFYDTWLGLASTYWLIDRLLRLYKWLSSLKHLNSFYKKILIIAIDCIRSFFQLWHRIPVSFRSTGIMTLVLEIWWRQSLIVPLEDTSSPAQHKYGPSRPHRSMIRR